MVSGEISPDLVEWLVADQKVCGKWRSLGRRLGLGPHMVLVDGTTPAGRRRGYSDPACLLQLLRLWKERKPETFTVRTLKSLLAAEGLHDMWMWINMMTQESPLKTEVTSAVYSRISSPTSPSSPSSPGTHTPWSSHLYSSQRPSSPYSAFFRPTSSSTCPDYSPYPSVSSSPTSSRPPSRNSQTSDMQTSSYSRPGSQTSDWRPGSRQGTASCPTTPLSSRRGQFMDYLPLTSPGAIRSTPTPYRSSSSTTSSPSPKRKGVYDLLFRPDLIKLSSPSNWSRSRHNSGSTHHRSESEGSWSPAPTPQLTPRTPRRGEQQPPPRRGEEMRSQAELMASRELQKACDTLLQECRQSSEPPQSPASSYTRRPHSPHNTANLSPHRSELKLFVRDKRQEKQTPPPFSVSKVRSVQLDPVEPILMPSPKKGSNNTYSEYFDNLLSLIDKAAKDLSL